MRLVSVGAGAVGGTVATRLVRDGVPLTIFDTDTEHVALMRDPGLMVDGRDDGVPVRLDASASLPADVADLVLLAVRSATTVDALDVIAPLIGDTTDVVSLQNGLNETRIADAIGPHRTIGCVVGFGATWIAPGHLTLDAEGDLVIGRLDGTTDDRLTRARDLLTRAFPTRITDNVTGALWSKMLVNSMTVLGALGGMLTGDLLGTQARRRVVSEVIAEGIRVAHAAGVTLPRVLGALDPVLVDTPAYDAQADRVLTGFAERFGAIRSVTWRDFELGRPTEIDAVTGEIVRRGAELGVPTPLSSQVFARLKEIEAGARSPAVANLAFD